jgi:hypothetical protein
VHVVREQAASMLGVDGLRLDGLANGLVVLPQGDEREAYVPFNDSPVVEADGPIDGRKLPAIAANELYLSNCPIEWQAWTQRWEADREGKSPREPLLQHYRVLPQSA